MEGNQIKAAVREQYAKVAKGEATCGSLCGCIGGALVLDDYVSRLKLSGFASVEVEKHAEAAHKMVEVSGAVPPAGIDHLLSVNIMATK